MKNTIKKLNLNILYWALNAAENEPQPSESNQIDFAVGGQAVIEGVMMRSPSSISIAVRKQNGEISVQKRLYKTLTQRYKFLNVPIIRGVINLFEMMIIGTKAINFSAAEALDEDQAKELEDKKNSRNKVLETIMFSLSFIFAMAFSVFLFKFIPLWVTTYIESHFESVASNYIIFNLIDGLLKMSMFIGYILFLTVFEDFRRIFEYHGAEHKAIFAYEQKLDLTVENARNQTRFHPRCGTSFILIVFVLSIILYTFVPKQPNFWANLALRLAALPLIAGISYEYLKLSAKHVDKTIVKALVQPGLWFQRLTTSEPKDDQLEVGLHSLQVALEMEKEATSQPLPNLQTNQNPA